MRTGIIAKKIGMSRIFQPDGKNIPVTLLKVDQCKVIDHKKIEKDGYSALKISYGFSKKNRIGYQSKNEQKLFGSLCCCTSWRSFVKRN